jgi:cation/acetate symporter
MIHQTSGMALLVFLLFAGLVLGISFYLGRRAKSVHGYFAAGGAIPWAVNGIAFAGDYLSAASFLGICGMIAFFGYDGFLYSIGYLAGWIVALFIVAEPIKRMGRYTFADALDSQFNSRGIKLAAAISTLVVSCFYLIPQMVGAGALARPLIGVPHNIGVIVVGCIVTTIVITAGMVSTTWVQFIKGSLLVVLCAIVTILILARGLTTRPTDPAGHPRHIAARNLSADQLPGPVLPEEGVWQDKPYVRVKDANGVVTVWRKESNGTFSETQTVAVRKDGKKLVNGLPQGTKSGEADFHPVGYVSKLPGGVRATGALDPFAFLRTVQDSEVIMWRSDTVTETEGNATTIYYQKPTPGKDFMAPGSSPTFGKVRGARFSDKLDFLSLMLALFCGTASLPHILIRYYTIKDELGARRSTVVGIAVIGFFYVLTLFFGLGAMTSGSLDVTDSNMSAPLLARSISEFLFAVLSAVAFTTILGTVSGLIMASSGAVVHDIMTHVLQMKVDEHRQVRAARITSLCVGIVAMVLGILFRKLNVNFLVGWAFNIAASANLPALVMVLFWKRATRQGITAAITVGMLASLIWILLSAQAYRDVYNLDPARAVVPFSQPAIVTIPLGFVVLVLVSLLTQPSRSRPAFAGANRRRGP